MNWRTIKDYPKYQISDAGLVMNSRGHIMKSCYNGHGYMVLCLYKDNKRRHFKIHRLVAIAFVPNPENKREVDHIDRCKDNNCISNLRWSTRSENLQNVGIRKDNTSGHKNIHYRKDTNKFVFEKAIDGKKICKSFRTLEKTIEFKKLFLHC